MFHCAAALSQSSAELTPDSRGRRLRHRESFGDWREAASAALAIDVKRFIARHTIGAVTKSWPLRAESYRLRQTIPAPHKVCAHATASCNVSCEALVRICRRVCRGGSFNGDKSVEYQRSLLLAVSECVDNVQLCPSHESNVCMSACVNLPKVHVLHEFHDRRSAGGCG